MSSMAAVCINPKSVVNHKSRSLPDWLKATKSSPSNGGTGKGHPMKRNNKRDSPSTHPNSKIEKVDIGYQDAIKRNRCDEINEPAVENISCKEDMITNTVNGSDDSVTQKSNVWLSQNTFESTKTSSQNDSDTDMSDNDSATKKSNVWMSQNIFEHNAKISSQNDSDTDMSDGENESKIPTSTNTADEHEIKFKSDSLFPAIPNEGTTLSITDTNNAESVSTEKVVDCDSDATTISDDSDENETNSHSTLPLNLDHLPDNTNVENLNSVLGSDVAAENDAPNIDINADQKDVENVNVLGSDVPTENDASNVDINADQSKDVPKSQGSSSGTAHTSQQNSNTRRLRCQYGSRCYRLNQQHKLIFSHPGDYDYPLNEERKPFCMYGSSCYRKNPLHLQQYDHSGPSRQLRVRVTTAINVNLNNYSDPDEPEDFEEPFICSSDEYELSSSDSDDIDSDFDEE